MNAASIIPLTAIAIFSLLILQKKPKTPSDFLLLGINLSLALIIYSEYAVFNDGLYGWELFIHFNSIYWMVSLFFSYAYSMVDGKGQLVFKWWFFAFSAPFFLFSAYDLLIDPSKIPADYESLFVDPTIIYHLFFKLHKIFFIAVGFHILRQIRRYNVALKHSHSSLDQISLHWLRNYTIVLMGFYAIHLVIFLLFNLGFIPEISEVYLVTGVLLVFAVFYLSYHGIRAYNVSTIYVELPLSNGITKSIKEKTSNEKLEENKVIFHQVKSLFEAQQTYTDPNLKIGLLAEQLNVPSYRLSQAINENYGRPFYDFVSNYRTKLLQEKLIAPQNSNYTIMALALEVGFNSKASLNRIFKEQTGMTPSQFQKSHLTN
ncbi:MAG: helix-turn-helix domain-containing protein [Bacteroidota bacterium]